MLHFQREEPFFLAEVGALAGAGHDGRGLRKCFGRSAPNN